MVLSEGAKEGFTGGDMLEMVFKVQSANGTLHVTYPNGRVGNVSFVEEKAQFPWKKLSVA